MSLKNDILSSAFLDFQIFATSASQNTDFESNLTNNFSTLVLYKDEDESEELEKFLTSILTAAKLDLSQDVALIKKTDNTDFSFIQLKTKHTIKQFIIFGIHPKKLGINLDLKLYSPLLFQECTFLLADKLSDIQSDVSKKRALWTCLQNLYLK